MSGRAKVLLAMSGGVDSSVAAALLLREGYEVVGVFMRLGSVGDAFDELHPVEAACPAEERRVRIHHRGCCSVGDAADARLVAATLDIPLYVVNFRRDFGRIIDYFVEEYDRGRTPNPCVRCNDWLKFGKLFEYADELGAAHVATGHYARVDHDRGQARLRRGVDVDKDQSYVLFGLRPDRLARTLLPIGSWRKPDVRALARERSLPVFEKPDSQEICFVPDDDYAGLVARRGAAGVRPGEIVDESGRSLGVHPGHQHFTIGQRRGLGLSTPRPLYVVGKDAATNTVTVGEREAIAAIGCLADQLNWLVPSPVADVTFECRAQVRAHAPTVAVDATVRQDGTLVVRFTDPVDAVAPGQAIVLYDEGDDVVLGGGWIRDVARNESAPFLQQHVARVMLPATEPAAAWLRRRRLP